MSQHTVPASTDRAQLMEDRRDGPRTLLLTFAGMFQSCDVLLQRERDGLWHLWLVWGEPNVRPNAWDLAMYQIGCAPVAIAEAAKYLEVPVEGLGEVMCAECLENS